jgi:UDP-GlcNAc:undecaprenyl-phosphate GlcNAc-1-phosphate transferase
MRRYTTLRPDPASRSERKRTQPVWAHSRRAWQGLFGDRGIVMRNAVVAFMVALLSAAAITPIVRAVAIHNSWFDHPLSTRNVHVRPVPRLGGVAIVCAFLAPFIGLLLTDSTVVRLVVAHRADVVCVVLGGLVIAMLGVWDDLCGANATQKLAIQFGVAAVTYGLGFRIDEIATPLGDVALGWVGLPFTVLWIAGIVNAVNLIDGLDGLAAGVALIGIICNAIVAIQRGDALMVLVSAALAGAVFGFLFFNFNPASIFMGDTGSMFLGFFLATTSIWTYRRSATAVSLLAPAVTLALPIADTSLALGRRYLGGRPLFRGDREHIHHRLIALGLTHRRAVLALYVASGLLGTAALVVANAEPHTVLLILAAVIGPALIALRAMGYLSSRQIRALLRGRSRNLSMRRCIDEIGTDIRHASTPEEVWNLVKRATERLHVAVLAMEVRGTADGAPLQFREPASDELTTFRYQLDGHRTAGGFLEIITVGTSPMDRDTEIGLEILCGHVHAALERIGRGRRAAPAAPAGTASGFDM